MSTPQPPLLNPLNWKVSIGTRQGGPTNPILARLVVWLPVYSRPQTFFPGSSWSGQCEGEGMRLHRMPLELRSCIRLAAVNPVSTCSVSTGRNSYFLAIAA
jgi:hypothetical protein